MASKSIVLRGEWQSRRVWVDGKELNPAESLRISNHSPDGFAWGYGGSGPSQLALAICLLQLGRPGNYQKFKWDHIAGLPHSSFEKVIEFNPEDYV